MSPDPEAGPEGIEAVLHHASGGRELANGEAGPRDTDFLARFCGPVVRAKSHVKQQEIEPEEEADGPGPRREKKAALDKAGEPGKEEQQAKTPSAKRTVRNEFRRENRLVVERIHVAFLWAGWI